MSGAEPPGHASAALAKARGSGVWVLKVSIGSACVLNKPPKYLYKFLRIYINLYIYIYIIYVYIYIYIYSYPSKDFYIP